MIAIVTSLSGSSNPGFTPGSFPWDYGLVTLGIFAAGFGLVEAGHRLRSRIRTRRNIAVIDGGTASA